MHCPAQSRSSLFGIGHNRRNQVRNPIVVAQFYFFRVNHQEFYLIRCSFVQNTIDQRIHAHRFPGPCRPGNEQVGHFSQIGNNRLAADIFPQCYRQFRLIILEHITFHYFTQAYHTGCFIWNFNPYCRFARNRCFNTHTGYCHAQCNIVSQIHNFAYFYAGCRLKLVLGNSRTAANIGNFPFYTEIIQGLFQSFYILLQFGCIFAPHAVWIWIQQLNGRKLVYVFFRYFHRYKLRQFFRIYFLFAVLLRFGFHRCRLLCLVFLCRFLLNGDKASLRRLCITFHAHLFKTSTEINHIGCSLLSFRSVWFYINHSVCTWILCTKCFVDFLQIGHNTLLTVDNCILFGIFTCFFAGSQALTSRACPFHLKEFLLLRLFLSFLAGSFWRSLLCFLHLYKDKA